MTAVFPTPLPCLRYAERVMGCYKRCCCQGCLGGDASCKSWKINSCRSVMMCAKNRADTANNSDGTEVKDQRCSLVSKFSLLNKYLIFSRQSSRRSTFNISILLEAPWSCRMCSRLTRRLVCTGSNTLASLIITYSLLNAMCHRVTHGTVLFFKGWM